MRATFVAAARCSGVVYEFPRFAAHPPDKVPDFRVFPERLGCQVIVCETAFAEGPVQHAVADDMDVTRAIAAFRFRNPMMSIDTWSIDHRPPANGTGAERLCGPSLAGHGSASSGAEFLEQPYVLLDVVGLLVQRLRIPFAARCRKEVAAIDVDSAGQPRDRVGH